MSAKIFRFEVTHPEYGTVIVESIGEDSATMAAASKWGAEWTKVAGYCRARKLGVAKRPRCKRCHREYGEGGDPAALCPDCLRALEVQRRQLAAIGHRDRRAGMRER